VADPDDIIDPNDLDSIDALLDEAELDAGDLEDIEPELPSAVPETVEQETAAIEEVELEPQTAPEVQEAEDELISEGQELQADAAPEPEQEPQEDLIADEVVAAAAGAAAATAINQGKAPEASPEQDDIEKELTERQINNQKQDLTVKQMESLKKIIIIFGAVIIVLVLAAIGIGVWGALSASNQHLPEETQTMLETIKVNSDHNIDGVKTLSEDLHSIEKKLDAVNFQVEQLATDLIKIQGDSAAQPVQLDPLGLNTPTENKPQEAPAPVMPVQVPNPTVASVIDPKILQKIDSINYRLIKAQKAIDSIGSQIQKVQHSQQEVVHSVKSVEKQQLLEMKLRAEEEDKKLAEEKAKKQANPYSYQTPDGMFYDQGVKDSYP
jgi:hypothetical protein